MICTFPSNSFWLFSREVILFSILDSNDTIYDCKPIIWFLISSSIWFLASGPLLPKPYEYALEETSVPVYLEPAVNSFCLMEYYFEEEAPAPLIELLKKAYCWVALVSSVAIYRDESSILTFLLSSVPAEKTSPTFSSLVKSAVYCVCLRPLLKRTAELP